ncbi:dTDP-4-dehydrorhamnose 3,5-epimerase family protein [Williamsia phyllosphaerae]|uniref:dTDP-4-dehydrorhamnose 3,5-epimerase RmlC n=1 Tax=Williamsia phyllosphaerae TaxID=885042 RepID=A0ABQ1U6N8_9NOCA|nr:dTDP-4-dehydrorhamnose 3,5-epimerase [Williamsia phyllosphaerae]GGF10214.1 DTDP-4-dehydrorhamnose 3,5-epimerase RmlC [Williamsia phyllosphaerae]
MRVRPLSVAGAWEFTPVQHPDPRGVFLEAFKASVLGELIGHEFSLAQVNTSVSAAGVLRGVHFADTPPGQAKYVTCSRGAILDVVVDIRVGSPTFGQWDSVVLDDVDRRAVYLSEGLGHAFLSLADDSTVAYFCSTGYNPGGEHGIHPLDPAIGIDWPVVGRDGSPLEVSLSDKDTAAPTLEQAAATGLLPRLDDVERYLSGLAARDA